MYKGKNLLILLGVGALAYYLFMMNKKKKDAAASTPAVKNFTGDLGVFNASGNMGC